MYEIKKIFVYNKGIWIILGGFLLYAICLYATCSVGESSKAYMHYLDKVNGELSNEKEDFLEDEAVKISEANASREILLDDFYNGIIPEKKYKEQMQIIEEQLQYEKGFEQIYNQYLYICEDKEQRYFMDYTGWQCLFSDNLFIIFASTMILLMNGQVFCKEYQVQMDILCKTCKNNKRNLVRKIWIANTLAVAICITLSLIQYLFYKEAYGLSNGSFPVQSVPYFSSCSRHISCLETFRYLVVIRSLGGTLFGNVIFMLSIITHKLSLTVCMSVALQVLPFFGFTGSDMYWLPFPVSFMQATGFLLGNQYSIDELTGEKILIFKEIPAFYEKIQIVVLLSGIILMGFYVVFREQNKWERRIRKKNKPVLFIIISTFCMITGCGNSYHVRYFDQSYNTMNADCYENELVKVYVKAVGDYPIIEEKENGETRNLISNSLQSLQYDLEIPAEFFGVDNYLYYIRIERKDYYRKVGQNSNRMEKASVVEVNLNDFSENVIFEQIISTGRQFIGFSYDVEADWDFLIQHSEFFLNEKFLFFVCNNGIYKVNRATKNIELLDIVSVKNIAFYQNCIYYIGNDSLIYSYNVESAETKLIIDKGTADFILWENKIYFINRQDNRKIWTYDLETGGLEAKTNQSASRFRNTNGKVEYEDGNDGLFYEIN